MSKLTPIIGGLLALVILAIALRGCSSGMPVDAVAVSTGPIRQFIDEEAKTRLPETWLVTMPAAGRIEAIPLIEGARVAKGQVVARIVPRDIDLAVRQAEAAVVRLDASIAENADVNVEQTGYKQAVQFVKSTASTVEAAYERVKSGGALLDYNLKNLSRVQRLAVTGAQSQDDLDRATLQKLQSGFDLQQDKLVHAALLAAQAATDLMPAMIQQYIDRKTLTGNVLKQQKAEAALRLAQVEQDKQRATMLSPIDGVVLNRFVSNERFLSAGEKLLEIGRLEDMEVEAEILSLDVVAAKVGDRVEIYGPAIGRPTAKGVVARIYPAGFTKVSSLGVEQQRVKVIVHIDPADLERLLADRRLGVAYHVRVRIITAAKDQAQSVPRAALFRSNKGEWQVFAIRGGKARLQTVEVGLINDQQAEITAGLAAGEQVILAPESTIADGARVQPRG